MSWITSHEASVRLGAFIGVFVVMALWEVAAARREPRASKGSRWFANLGITALNTVILRLVFP